MVIVYNIGISFLLYISNNYILSSLFKILSVGGNLYLLYYLFLFISLKYVVDNDNLTIIGIYGLKKVTIPIKNIKGYNEQKGKIKGIRLSGIANNSFALGRSIIDKIGVTRMFVTQNDNVFYLNTDEINYACSPKNYSEFERVLKDKGLEDKIWEHKYTKKISLHKDKRFIFLFTLVSIIIIVITLNPFILYLKHILPATMPLSFDAAFKPVLYGTSKQFAFKQMVYGALNMVILFCMYYASYFHAKYDKKSSYIYIYVALIIALVFLVLQFRILYVYW
ncbi:PH domain-containing protein [Haloimpatiens sp. FM7330]